MDLLGVYTDIDKSRLLCIRSGYSEEYKLEAEF